MAEIQQGCSLPRPCTVPNGHGRGFAMVVAGG